MKIGLVVAGGLSRGAAQIGFLKSFFKYIPREDIEVMTSASIGVLSAIAVSTNKIDTLAELFTSYDFDNAKSLIQSLKHHLFFNIIDALIDDTDEIQIPMYITCSCLSNQTSQYFLMTKDTKKEDLVRFANISCTFPFLNGVLRRYNHKFYMDGGFYDCIPTYPLRFHNVDMIVIVHCASNYIPPADLIMSDIPVLDVHVTSKNHRDFKSFSFQNHNLKAMFKIGSELGEEVGQKLSKCQTKEEIKEMCQQFIHEHVPFYQQSHSFLSIVELLNRIYHSRFPVKDDFYD